MTENTSGNINRITQQGTKQFAVCTVNTTSYCKCTKKR